MNTENPKPESENQETESAPQSTTKVESQGESVKRSKIQIGSQRDAANTALKPSQPKAVQQAMENPVDIVEKPVEEVEEIPAQINSSEGFSEDVDAEIEAAIGGVSMDSLMGGMSEGEEELEPNSRLKATITRTHGENVFVSLKGRFEGVVPLAQFKSPPSDGQLVEVIVKNRNEDDALYEVAIPGSSVSVGDWDDVNVNDVVEARVTGSNTGGLEVNINGLRGFIPASQIDRFRVENFGEYVNQKLQCVVTEVNPGKKKLVLSRRAILERENEEKRKELLASIAVGDQHDGTVTKLMDFGAFVDIGGVEGLVHVSKLSWDRVTHPKEVVTEGERVKVKIERVDQETGKISLSIRDMIEHPWDDIDSKFTVNETVKGKVTKLADFGAFVKLAPGIEGLVHVSEIAHHRVMRVSNHVNVGDEVEVKILSMDTDKQKLGLSIKATQTAPVKEVKAKDDEDDNTPIRESAVPKSNAPLKGGTDRKTGGEDIGLNW
jgi:small subunit ribosomal protein S1